MSKLGKTGKYNFKRSTIGVGAPIDFEFPNVQFSGTIMTISEKPLIEKYVEKTIYMTKKYAYLWEYDAIHIGISTLTESRQFLRFLVRKLKTPTI